MILDSGICTIFVRMDVSEPGQMPRFEYRVMDKGWYGKLAFETSPANPTGNREEVQTSARIRVLQNTSITNHNRVVLRDADAYPAEGEPAEGEKVYDVTRAYHGYDDDNGQPISDITLTEVDA